MQNDLDLDLFCREVIRADIAYLKRTPTRNAVLDAHQFGDERVLDGAADAEDRLGRRGRVEEVFGACAVADSGRRGADMRAGVARWCRRALVRAGRGCVGTVVWTCPCV